MVLNKGFFPLNFSLFGYLNRPNTWRHKWKSFNIKVRPFACTPFHEWYAFTFEPKRIVRPIDRILTSLSFSLSRFDKHFSDNGVRKFLWNKLIVRFSPVPRGEQKLCQEHPWCSSQDKACCVFVISERETLDLTIFGEILAALEFVLQKGRN